jgi:sugar phosphate permease
MGSPINSTMVLKRRPSASISPAVESALRRRWWYLLPAVFITYSLAYLDRANYGLGAAAGLAATLHITGKQNSLLGALFFLGYFVFQLPGTMLVGKRSPVRLIFVSLGVWGILAALTGVIRIFWALALDRFLLGVAESCIFPAMLLLLTRWFTRSERSRANALLIVANSVTLLWMSVITGYLIGVFGWQRTFVYEGIPAVLWAAVWIAIAVTGRRKRSRWLRRRQNCWNAARTKSSLWLRRSRRSGQHFCASISSSCPSFTSAGALELADLSFGCRLLCGEEQQCQWALQGCFRPFLI